MASLYPKEEEEVSPLEETEAADGRKCDEIVPGNLKPMIAAEFAGPLLVLANPDDKNGTYIVTWYRASSDCIMHHSFHCLTMQFL